eukprot:PhF_6_TR37925/c1_g1_i1/m.56672
MSEITAISVAPDTANQGGRVVVFTKPHCPFCTRVKLLFESLGIDVVYKDYTEYATEYQDVSNRTNHPTLPLVLVDGELLGGCDSTCIAVDNGALQRKLNLPSMKACIPKDKQRLPPPAPGLFLFPPAASRWMAQLVALQVVAVGIVIIYYRKESWAWWVCFAMTLDFVIRVVAGATPSILGANALLITPFLPEELVPGPPKQFAAFCGVFFFGLATILYHAGHGDTSEIGGSVVVGVVLGCAFLEGFLNFCVGCFVYGIMNALRLIPDSVYQPYTDHFNMLTYTLKDTNVKYGWRNKINEPFVEVASEEKLVGWRREDKKEGIFLPVVVNQNMPPHGFHSEVDVPYKFPKTDDTIREHWGPYYIQFEDFGMVLGIAGIAAMLKWTSDVMYVPKESWFVIGILAGCIYGLMLSALVLKLIFHSRKFYMDLQHPFKRNALAILPIINLVFVYLLNDQENEFMFVAWWAGAPPMALHLTWSLALWMKHRKSGEHVNPGLIVPAAGCMVAALMAAMVGVNRTGSDGYAEAGMWFFGFGFLTFIILFAVTFTHGLTYHWSDDRLRPLVAFWMGACFITQLAYQAINNMMVFDTFCFIFWATGVILFLANLYLVYPGRWLLRGRFVMANWTLAFPLDVFAMAAVNYYKSTNHNFAYGIMWVALIFAVWANYTMFFHTLNLFLYRQWPRAPIKWGPLAFNKLQHEAMRVLIDKLKAEIALPVPKDAGQKARAQERFMCLFQQYKELAVIHAEYEDHNLFPELKAINASQITLADQQHNKIDEQVHQIETLVQSEPIDFDALRTIVLEHVDLMLDHVQWEEDHMQPLIRKYLNLDIQIKILQNVWSSVPLPVMEATLTTVISNLPMHGQRVRYIKALLWALPERAQEVGLWLYRGLASDPLGDAKYALIVQDLPEIAPRGSGWEWNRVL